MPPTTPGWAIAPNSAKGLFGLYLFDWVTKPSWLYRVLEGVHVMLGLVLVPVVLAKLWSVMPKLFDWPPWRSVAQLLERVSLVLVVGGIVFEMTTGILNINYFTQINFYSGPLLRGVGVHRRILRPRRREVRRHGGRAPVQVASGPNCGQGSPAPGPRRSTAPLSRPSRRHPPSPDGGSSPWSAARRWPSSC